VPRWAIGCLVAVIVVLATVFQSVVSSKASGPVAQVTFAFPPSVYPSGLVVAREWSFTDRRGSQLHARVRVTNGGSAVVSSSVDEVIPKSLAPSIATIRFSPPPDQIVRSDPVVRYTIKELQPGHALDLVYAVSVPPDGASLARLQDWGAAQVVDQAAYLAETPGAPVSVTLSGLTVSPTKVSLVEGRTYQLSPAGTMSDGTPAPALVLANLVWSSSNPSVIGVADGRLTANEVGVATVSARTGSLGAEVFVTVMAPETGGSSTSTLLPAPTYRPPEVIVNPPTMAVVTTVPAEVTTTVPPPEGPRGTILADVVTDPAGGLQAFQFDPSYGANFSSTDAATPHSSGPLVPGSYSLAEVNIPPGWDLTAAGCSDGSPPDRIDLGAGETVTCTFTNQRRGTILVDVVTNPSGSAQAFEFSPSYGADFTLTDAGAPNSSGSLVPGIYRVDEVNIPSGWDLTGASCSDGSPPARINLAPGETITCTFTNTQQVPPTTVTT
jgi:hypothetical protein